ncbi:hypothetical protein RDMS_00340 [Deinococcus sp. RL]|uniref:hypothetical protein n=1 Tax=Deinococcus sp. RL TaxID=1489678 RepID=UPI0004D3687E|nr:hypothetical protein [Deinococcus sp. RL]KEF35752.1 hypothetical protein RDMS_00340 [Deinococcus sp. RL]
MTEDAHAQANAEQVRLLREALEQAAFPPAPEQPALASPRSASSPALLARRRRKLLSGGVA